LVNFTKQIFLCVVSWYLFHVIFYTSAYTFKRLFFWCACRFSRCPRGDRKPERKMPSGPFPGSEPNSASFPVKVAISVTAFGPSFGPQRAKGQRGKGARGYPAMTRILRPDGNKWWSLGNWVAGICGFLWAGPYLHAGNRCGRPRRLTFDHQNSITVLGTCSRLTLLNFLLSIRNSGTK